MDGGELDIGYKPSFIIIQQLINVIFQCLHRWTGARWGWSDQDTIISHVNIMKFFWPPPTARCVIPASDKNEGRRHGHVCRNVEYRNHTIFFNLSRGGGLLEGFGEGGEGGRRWILCIKYDNNRKGMEVCAASSSYWITSLLSTSWPI